MLELFGVALDAVGFGIGLLLPYIISWAIDQYKARRRRTV